MRYRATAGVSVQPPTVALFSAWKSLHRYLGKILGIERVVCASCFFLKALLLRSSIYHFEEEQESFQNKSLSRPSKL